MAITAYDKACANQHCSHVIRLPSTAPGRKPIYCSDACRMVKYRAAKRSRLDKQRDEAVQYVAERRRRQFHAIAIAELTSPRLSTTERESIAARIAYQMAQIGLT